MATRQQTILRIGIIGGALLLILVVVIVVRNMSIVKQSASEAEQRDRMHQMVNGSLALCDDDPYPSACRSQLVNKQAREYKSSEMCEVLEGEERVSCVNVVVRETLDAKDCSILKGDERSTCKDHVINLAAQDKLELVLCTGIEGQAERELCTSVVTDMIVDSGRCVELGVDPGLCKVKDTISRASNATNPDICNDLQGDDKSNCLTEVEASRQDADFFIDDEPVPEPEIDLTLDSDLDGLTDERERSEYGTDPFNPDTDGDGYDDKTEIEGGFNPLGSG
jgi:hypothetical protein